MQFRMTFVLVAIFLLNFAVYAAEQNAFSQLVFLTQARINLIKQRIERKQEPQYSAFLALEAFVKSSRNNETHAPIEWYVPGYYRDAKGHAKSKQGLQDDANTAYGLALYYRITGNEAYATEAARFIDAWAQTVESMSDKDGSTLSFSYHFPALIFAADLIHTFPKWPISSQERFKQFVRNKALPMNTMDRKNNWGNWGLVLVLASASYLNDKPLFDRGVERWKEFIDLQIADDGHLPHEVNRSEGKRGIWYTHFSLMPQTIAGEIARVNGVDLFPYQSPGRKNLRIAFEKAARWTLKPSEFPYFRGAPDEMLGVRYFSYFEILQPRWQNEEAGELLENSRPQSARHSAPFLTLTHGNLSYDI